MTSAKMQIDNMLHKLDELKQLGVRAAPSIVRVMDAYLRRTIAAGTDPYGNPWAPRKSDGGRTLVHADKTLKVTWHGRHIIVEIHGIDARHHKGAVKGRVKRPIIFNKKELPPALVEEIRRALAAEYQAIVAGDSP